MVLGIRRVRASLAVLALALAAPAAAQLGEAGATPPLLRAMEGTWDVAQRTWAGPDAPPEELPPAVAERHVAAGGGYLQEVMTAAGAEEPFTRTAILNRNALSGRFEYVSMDSRAPQQMTYQSPPDPADASGPLRLDGGLFVAARWGEAADVAFAYRLEVGPVEGDRQVVRLFLTPQAAGDQREFLAFEYVFTRAG